MTDTLRIAVAQAEALPEPDQDALAAVILAEIEAEAAWDGLFARPESEALLARMAAEAMDDLDAGRTRPLDELLGTAERGVARHPGVLEGVRTAA